MRRLVWLENNVVDIIVIFFFDKILFLFLFFCLVFQNKQSFSICWNRQRMFFITHFKKSFF